MDGSLALWLLGGLGGAFILLFALWLVLWSFTMSSAPRLEPEAADEGSTR